MKIFIKLFLIIIIINLNLIYYSCSIQDSNFNNSKNENNNEEIIKKIEEKKEDFFNFLEAKSKSSSNKLKLLSDGSLEINGFDQTLDKEYYITTTNIEVILTNPDGSLTNFNIEIPITNEIITISLMSPKDTVIALSMAEQYANNDNKNLNTKSLKDGKPCFDLSLNRYLINNGIYDKYKMTKDNIIDLYKEIEYIIPPNMKEEILRDKINFKNGDILLCYGRSSKGEQNNKWNLGFLIPGKWKHAGILDYEKFKSDKNKCIISASDDVYDINGNKIENGGLGGAVGYERIKKWSEEIEIEIYRLKNISETKINNAIEYARRKLVGNRNFNFFDTIYKEEKIWVKEIRYYKFLWFSIPYDIWVEKIITKKYLLPANKHTDNNWYCSKVVYRCLLTQGINVEYSGSRNSDFQTANDIAANLGLNIIAGGELTKGYGDYEFVLPQNIADAVKDGILEIVTNIGYQKTRLIDNIKK